MRPVRSSFKTLFYGVCLVAVLYNCKTKDVDSLTPFTYTFKGIDDVKLPEVTATAPAAVSVTASSVNTTTTAAAVSAGLTTMSATGPVPAAVTKASDDVSKVVPDAKAAEITAAFTPDVVNTLATTGTLPASLQADVNAIANNPALAAYMPTFTLPTVDGKAVGGRVGAVGSTPVVDAVSVNFSTLDGDACKAAAAEALAKALARLDAQKATQTDAVNARFAALQAPIQADATACKASVPATYAAYKVAAKQQLDQTLAALNSNKARLGGAYNILVVLTYVVYARTIGVFDTLQKADLAACDTTAAAKLAKAQAARDADLSKINNGYNTASAALQAARDKAVASCHNQGNGG
jgi:hypothetical protein